MDAKISTTPARARTDVPTTPPPSGTPSEPDTGPGTGPATGPAISPAAVRKLGLALSAGTLSWAASIFVYGSQAQGFGERVGDLTGLLFQLGIFALLAVQIRTRATGISRFARVMLKVELVLLGLAAVWSLLHGVLPDGLQDGPVMQALDVFWPVSMLGMMAIGIKVALAGRWRGALRWWPLVAESWAVVTVPTYVLFGDSVSNWVGGFHLVIGYATLGALLALRPGLTD
ncbi:hypothetical protein ACFFV7_14655 [Nonomuraea spiralis]|uniref:Uncharacterized protein n=1 Tax=Nonomuraea spiralis TaxID=46182 RepID=A0ABV5ID20_9ACTN|nr:hypothetical protein [Nonomuraea spiralis]